MLTDWFLELPIWQALFSEDPDSLRLLYSLLIGLAVFAAVLAVYFVVSGFWNPLRKRVASVKETGVSNPLLHGVAPAAQEREPGLLEKLGAAFTPKDPTRRSDTEALLRYANFRQEGALRVFFGLKLIGLVLVPLLVFAGLRLGMSTPLPIDQMGLYLLMGAMAGYLIPSLVLTRIARNRQDRLRRGLPDAMDLLVVCSEAGLGLGAAIQRVAAELNITHPDLADELALFSLQSRAGMDNRAALKDLEARTGLEDIQSLVAMLLQSMRFGTSIADTLRIFADELRDKRIQRAQEKAARVGTLMIFPLIFCILPSFLLVILGPAVLGTIRVLAGSPIGN